MQTVTTSQQLASPCSTVYSACDATHYARYHASGASGCTVPTCPVASIYGDWQNELTPEHVHHVYTHAGQPDSHFVHYLAADAANWSTPITAPKRAAPGSARAKQPRATQVVLTTGPARQPAPRKSQASATETTFRVGAQYTMECRTTTGANTPCIVIIGSVGREVDVKKVRNSVAHFVDCETTSQFETCSWSKQERRDVDGRSLRVIRVDGNCSLTGNRSCGLRAEWVEIKRGRDTHNHLYCKKHKEAMLKVVAKEDAARAKAAAAKAEAEARQKEAEDKIAAALAAEAQAKANEKAMMDHAASQIQTATAQAAAERAARQQLEEKMALMEQNMAVMQRLVAARADAEQFERDEKAALQAQANAALPAEPDAKATDEAKN